MQQEIDIAGVYVSPFVVVAAIGLVVFLALRAFLDRVHFDQYVWHRPLVDAFLFVIILAVLVLIL